MCYFKTNLEENMQKKNNFQLNLKKIPIYKKLLYTMLFLQNTTKSGNACYSNMQGAEKLTFNIIPFPF